MKKRLFITATGTDIGKTFVTAALVRQATALSKSVMAYKPMVTGFDESQIATTDTGMILESLKLSPSPENIARATPWRYKAPLAPSMAARLENRAIKFDDLIAWSRTVIDGPEDIVLIEGVGGVMVPLDDTHTVLDWHAATGIAAVLVTGSYLGTISHTLTALAVFAQRNIEIASIVVNESATSPVSLDDTADEIRRWVKGPVITVKRRGAADGWKDVPELRALLT